MSCSLFSCYRGCLYVFAEIFFFVVLVFSHPQNRSVPGFWYNRNIDELVDLGEFAGSWLNRFRTPRACCLVYIITLFICSSLFQKNLSFIRRICRVVEIYEIIRFPFPSALIDVWKKVVKWGFKGNVDVGGRRSENDLFEFSYDKSRNEVFKSVLRFASLNDLLVEFLDIWDFESIHGDGLFRRVVFSDI